MQCKLLDATLHVAGHVSADAEGFFGIFFSGGLALGPRRPVLSGVSEPMGNLWLAPEAPSGVALEGHEVLPALGGDNVTRCNAELAYAWRAKLLADTEIDTKVKVSSS